MRDAHRELLRQMAMERYRAWFARFVRARPRQHAGLCKRIAWRYTEMMERWADHG